MILNSPYISGSLTVTGNTTLIGALTVTGSLAGTATSASFAYTASSAVSAYTAASAVNATTALTASYATSFTVGGTLTAQTLVVQTITSSIVFSSGSNSFGNQLANNQTFTGSVNITGSLAIAGNITGNAITLTGALSGTSATFSGRIDINADQGAFRLYNTAAAFVGGIGNGSWVEGATITNVALYSIGDLKFYTGGSSTNKLTIASTGAATFSSAITSGDTVSAAKSKAGSGVESLSLLDLKLLGASAIGDNININFLNNTINIARISGVLGGDNVAYGSLAFSTRNFFTDSMVEVMRINNRGNVGIGTSSPTKLLSIGTSAAAPTNGFNILYGTDEVASFTSNAGTGEVRIGATNAIGTFFTTFYSNNAERMRITSGGYLKLREATSSTTEVHILRADTTTDAVVQVNNSNNSQASDGLLSIIATRNTSNNTFYAFGYYNVGAGAWKIRVADSGNVTNTNGSYGTISSDRRLKENIVLATPKLDDLLKLNVVNFNLIGNEEKHIGFIAQEMQEVFPSFVYQNDTRKYDDEGNLISGLEDALGLKIGMEFAILVKAIQEQQAQIKSQDAKIEELKALIAAK